MGLNLGGGDFLNGGRNCCSCMSLNTSWQSMVPIGWACWYSHACWRESVWSDRHFDIHPELTIHPEVCSPRRLWDCINGFHGGSKKTCPNIYQHRLEWPRPPLRQRPTAYTSLHSLMVGCQILVGLTWVAPLLMFKIWFSVFCILAIMVSW